jgi:hypothetical protein
MMSVPAPCVEWQTAVLPLIQLPLKAARVMCGSTLTSNCEKYLCLLSAAFDHHWCATVGTGCLAPSTAATQQHRTKCVVDKRAKVSACQTQPGHSW